ncbi:Mss4-like protein [Rozella allomycis CSF55]|uniref:Mss4-like domain-containing protein n=1 Tax=Rozella allomycis (strain CSF55) TaxID=988480 RepID=A0A075APN7_ROZAC|nr:Mss4-like domain-containing protein [Rozella allomycis CSF55]RKP16341.1 Mss4-like protein [Rozella allomycis CSF55]|eukprot:EPZ32124.1 Mss4-like domain-containing protein [Rozella allomycis CSF55]
MTETNLNPNNIRCVNEKCRTLILKKNSAELKTNLTLPEMTSKSEKISSRGWFLSNIYTFDNIGVTKPTQMDSFGNDFRFLICAECEIGPLGYLDNANKSIFLAEDRVFQDDA